jgi:hypothetical protein
MFTWICPQCGREVPPSYNECPDCAPKAAAPPTPPEPVAATQAFDAARPAVAPPVAPPPPAAPAPVAPQAPPAPQFYAPPPSKGLPAWLMTILFALAFVGLGSGIYWGVGYMKSSGERAASAPAAAPVLETPKSKTGAKPHPLQKHLEIAGMRFSGDKKKTTVRFLLINHSEAQISDLAANITVWGRTQRSEEDPVGTITFKLADIGPNESKEVTADLNTKLKVYELPDWQNVSTDMQITAPAMQ